MTTLFIDLHTHILPEMDDGSEDAGTSVSMLRKEKESGISGVVLTPHFYPHAENPDSFLSRRKKAIELLLNEIKKSQDGESLPKLYSGAEVAFFYGISRSSETKKLNISGTDYILVEMPFRKWSSGEIKELIGIKERQNLFPIVAHIERYEKYQSKKSIEGLIENGILFQCNAESYINRESRKSSFRLIVRGAVNFISSDCHNMTDRAPNMGKALSIIADNISPEFLDDFGMLCQSITRFADCLN